MQRDIDLVGSARVFFHHMSVGDNVLAGLSRVAPTLALKEVSPADGPVVVDGPAVWHGLLGRNGDPLGKIAAFEAALDGADGKGLQSPPDIALMKLCYEDIQAETDVNALFARYQEAITRLKQKHPLVRFVHVTAPLLPKDTGVKEFIKGTLGFKDGNARANMARGRYNSMVKKSFGDDVIFDLAQAESTHPNGAVEAFEREGAVWQSLVPAYTQDGAHLAGVGQERAAQALVVALARALRHRPLAAAPPPTP